MMPKNLQQSATVAISGAEVAKDARKSLEQRGVTAISPKNAKELGIKELPFENKAEEDDF